MKTYLINFAKVIALTIILFICYAVVGGILGQQDPSQTQEEASVAAIILLAICFLDTLVLTHIILRSHWSGWKLMATVFLVFFGVMTFMAQIESAVFVTTLPSGMLSRLFLMGALVAAPFSMLAVLILGKRKAGSPNVESNTRLVMPKSEWTWKLSVIALSFIILYFTFGYFIAWQNPVLREYYGGIDEGSFFAHMAALFRDSFWLIPFQLMRSMLWTAIALPVVRMMKGGWLETSLALGLIFAVLMNAQLLLSNPYMPETVRLTHLVETASSNFIFGFLVGWLLARPTSVKSAP